MNKIDENWRNLEDWENDFVWKYMKNELVFIEISRFTVPTGILFLKKFLQFFFFILVVNLCKNVLWLIIAVELIYTHIFIR